MGDHPPKSVVRDRLQTTVSRPHKRQQGETVYGVREFNNNPPNSNWASSGKLFGDNDILTDNPKQRAEEYFYTEQALRDPQKIDTVLYKATVAIPNSRNGRDTTVVSPTEEVEVVLTNIRILDRRTPRESISDQS